MMATLHFFSLCSLLMPGDLTLREFRHLDSNARGFWNLFVNDPTRALVSVQPNLKLPVNRKDRPPRASHSLRDIRHAQVAGRKQVFDFVDFLRREWFSLSPFHGFL